MWARLMWVRDGMVITREETLIICAHLEFTYDFMTQLVSWIVLAAVVGCG